MILYWPDGNGGRKTFDLLPVATSENLGAVKVGNGLHMNGETLNADSYSATSLGGISFGNGLYMDGNTLKASGNVHFSGTFNEFPESPQEGSLAVVNGSPYIFDGTQWTPLFSADTSTPSVTEADETAGGHMIFANGAHAVLPSDLLANSTEFTIEVNFSSTSGAKHVAAYWQPAIVGCANNWLFSLNSGYLNFWANPESGSFLLESDVHISDGNFHKVAAVSNADGSLDLFCDGVLVAHKDDANVKTPEQNIGVCCDLDSGEYLSLDLRYIRFWNVARTPEQLFNNINGTETGLRAWYLPSKSGLRD